MAYLSTAAVEFAANPARIAPSLDPSVPTDFAAATRFLYTGSNPTQVGVDPATIDPRTVAVARGCVRDQDDRPLAGVRVSINNRPEFGSTLTGVDGQYNLAVNGGGVLTLNYELAGKLPAQRTMTFPVRDYLWADQVVLIALDPVATTLNLATPGMQVAQSSVVSDTDGLRQATLLVPQGTSAEMVMADGTTRLLPTITVRATEYTVGPNGPEMMPGTLPPQSGYTYALEYSVDQALTAGAIDVRFNQPIYHYVENFLNFRVGMAVPTGYYDRQKARWLPSDNGRVVKIVAITDGLAALDTDGDGGADNNPALGITDAERQRLAGLYQVGESLWRVPLTHFTPWDCNWPYGLGEGDGPPLDPALNPEGKDAAPEQQSPATPNPDCKPGSLIECQNQTLVEALELTGTPFSLHYRSDTAPGRTTASNIRIPISLSRIPASLKRIELEVKVAGRLFTQSFAPLPNQSTLFNWDGLDGYGRRPQGTQTVQIRLGYVYNAVYQEPANFAQSFAAVSGVPLTSNRARQEITLWRDWTTQIHSWDARGVGFGGWTLSDHHTYDQAGQTFYQGNGQLRRVNPVVPATIELFAGAPGRNDAGDGGSALEAVLRSPYSLAVAPDGTVYVSTHRRVRKIDTAGVITTIAGTGSFGFGGDGGPATQALISGVGGLALGPDGSVYFSDPGNHRIRRVDSAGIITTVAGNGTQANSGDGGPAVQAALNAPNGLSVAADGTLYVLVEDGSGGLIRQIRPDGTINTILNFASIPNFGPISPSLALGPDGTLYFQKSFGATVYGLTPGGTAQPFSEGGGIRRQHSRFTVNPSGELYVSYMFGFGGRVYRVNADKTLTAVVGTGAGRDGASGDGGPPLAATFYALQGSMAFGPDGSLYITDPGSGQIRRIGPALPKFSGRTTFVPSEDGSVIYVFDLAGRHERTIHARTGATLLTFGYSSAGRLVSITDGDGDVTRIERDAAGNLTAIVSQDGQRTNVSLDANGYLTRSTNPAGETTSFSYAASGLLTSMTDPRGSTASYAYDANGLLVSATDRGGATKTLERTGDGADTSIAYVDAVGRRTTYGIDRSPDGQVRLNNLPNGTSARTSYLPDGSIQTVMPSGMATSQVEAGDPRFGMMAPIVASTTITTPGGLRFQSSFTRTVTLAAPTRVLSLTTEVDRTTVNGRTFVSTYDAATRTFSIASPLGRSGQTAIDPQGRITQAATPGIAAVSYSYDPRGRLVGITQGTGTEARTVTMAYNGAGYLASITDPLGQTTTFSYDAAGRVTQQTDPGGRATAFAYDANGNLVALTPPGRTAHSFTYTPTDLTAAYTAPSVGGTTQTSYTYNAAQELTQMTDAGGRTLTLGYDSAGRVATLTTARGATSYSYSPTTGQLTNIAAPGGVGLGYTYDGGLLTGVVQSGLVSGQVGYAYDNDFRVTSTSVNGGSTISFSYDADGLLVGAGALSLTRNTQNGLLIGSALGTTTESWGYNSFAEPASYQASAGATGLYSVNYTRDKLGRITQKVEIIGGVTTTYAYNYDATGRLVEVRRGGTISEQYSYDANGNRLSATVSGVTSNGTYDAQDRLLTYGGQSFTYLPSGELRTRVQGGQTTTYDYDIQGNLVGVTLSDGRQLSYLIDGQDRRVGKLVNGALVQGFLYESQLRPIAELDGAGNIVSRFVYATGVNVPDYIVRGGTTYRIITDQVGSVRLVVNAATGAVAQRLDYDAFGNVLQDSAPGFQPFGFAGGLYDRDTSLVRFGARDYDPAVGRWTAKDPIGFAGGDGNLYVYAGNDAANSIDPNGLSALGDFLSGSASYFRGLYRLARRAARESGILGECERQRALQEGELVKQALQQLAKHPTLRRAAVEAAKQYLQNNKARVAGRAVAGAVAAASLGTLGTVLSAAAIAGDVAHYAERTRAVVPDGLAAAILGGE